MDFLPRVSVTVVGIDGEISIQPTWVKTGLHTFEWKPEPLPPHREIRIQQTFDFPAADCLLHHGALPRMVGRLVIRGDENWRAGWHSPLTGDVHFVDPVGAPGFGIYPPIVVLPDAGEAFLFGPVSEVRSRCIWEWAQNEKGMLVITATMRPWGIDGTEYPGEIESEGWFWQMLPAGSRLEPGLFDAYNDALSASLGPTAAQRNPDPGLTWATWNDGTFRDIDFTRIVGACDFLLAHHPEVRWIQIDDGWAGPNATPATEDGALAMSDFGAFYRPERLENDLRFPGGLKALATAIKSRGLRPMLWLTPAVADGSLLYQEHPEWFLTDARLSWMPEMRFLDFSNPNARDFVEGALDLAFSEWGFEGTKLDFWTMTFEETNVFLAESSKTAIEWMRWFLEAIRKRIPEDGLVLHCIGLPFGTPFRAPWCDHFRYYADSEGSCGVQEMAREQALWAAVLGGLYGVQRFWIPNGDGFGLFDHINLPENEHRRWAAFMLGSGTTTELCGWLHLKEDQAALERIRIVSQNAKLGAPISLPGFDFMADPPLTPSVWVRESDGASWLAGIANWTDEPAEFAVPGHGRLRELFTGELIDGGKLVVIPGRDGRVYVPAEEGPK